MRLYSLCASTYARARTPWQGLRSRMWCRIRRSPAMARRRCHCHTARQNKACADKLQFPWLGMMAKLLARRRNRGSVLFKWHATAIGGDAADVKNSHGDAQTVAHELECGGTRFPLEPFSGRRELGKTLPETAERNFSFDPYLRFCLFESLALRDLNCGCLCCRMARS